MPNWVTITADELPILPAEIEALRNLAPQTFDTFLPLKIAGIIANVRGQVAARTGMRLDADPSLIPPELKQQAMILVVAALKQDSAGVVSLNDDQKEAVRNARADLALVAAGKFVVSAPANPEPVPDLQMVNSGVTSLPPRPRQFDRCSTGGL